MLLVLAVHLGQRPSVQKWSFHEVSIAFYGPWSPTSLQALSLTHLLLLNPPDILEDGELVHLPMASLAEASIDPPFPQCRAWVTLSSFRILLCGLDFYVFSKAS